MNKDKRTSVEQSKKIKDAILHKGDELLNEHGTITDVRVEELEHKRRQYLQNIEEDEKKIETIMNYYAMEIYQAYLPEISKKYVPIVPQTELEEEIYFRLENRIRHFDITKWVTDPKEKNMDKLVNVYQTLANQDCNIALIYNRTVKESKVTIAISNVGEGDLPDMVDKCVDRLKKSMRGNFPGAIITNEERGTPIKTFKDYDEDKLYYSVAAISNLASDKSEDFVSQNIEKLLDGVIPSKEDEEYTLVLLAEPFQQQDSVKAQLSEIYSELSPFMQWQSNIAVTEGEMLGAGATAGVNAGASLGATFFVSLGFNVGVNMSKMINETKQIGENIGATRTYVNYGVKHLLDTIEKQIARIEECTALGMWKFAAYAISQDATIAENVAHMYLSLTQGEKSFSEREAINFWQGGRGEDAGGTVAILNEIARLRHPRFGLNVQESSEGQAYEMIYPVMTDLTMSLSGRDLARALNFPRKSVTGLPVIECAEFGRNITTYDESKDDDILPLGKIFHMNRTEATDVSLNKNSLASHTFITGSTGAGKSNTVYKILGEARKHEVKFLVVEPAKGEYKNIFGNENEVFVYGTNKGIMPLLRIDPFSFPENIHVLEHLDRLIEIFNVCWPMYAAMPAVLKNAVERSYEECGWDLTESTNEFGKGLYPNFADVARNVKLIIDSSEYDSDNKGAYKGSLLTRLNSLTNGINGLVFNSKEISAEELFDKNVIVDLSRVGSGETKSLIMGMLVLKLQEYRMAQGGMNAELKHITVLEEAHNLLRRTSTEQPIEGANLLGKSVEMIANAIAEMRTYGEGFIIADQAPGLLDMSTIRNTNTKIIMRLPDQSDRELVGRAANLNENQITELAKLPQGVAAIYQTEWVQPVLCKIDKFKSEEKAYAYEEEITKSVSVDPSKRLKVAELLSTGTYMRREAILNEIDPILQDMRVASSVRIKIFKLLENPPKEPRMTRLAPVMSALFPNVRKAISKAYWESRDPMEWTNAAEKVLRDDLKSAMIQDQVRRDILQAIVIDYIFNNLGKLEDVERWTKEGVR